MVGGYKDQSRGGVRVDVACRGLRGFMKGGCEMRSGM